MYISSILFEIRLRVKIKKKDKHITYLTYRLDPILELHLSIRRPFKFVQCSYTNEIRK